MITEKQITKLVVFKRDERLDEILELVWKLSCLTSIAFVCQSCCSARIKPFSPRIVLWYSILYSVIFLLKIISMIGHAVFDTTFQMKAVFSNKCSVNLVSD